MNVALLIDSIVRQTTVLIAQLATAAGTRAPLAHTANQVFLDLVAELKSQGLGNKVIADMFGLALRTYHGKVRRLSESSTFRGRSLWSAVLEYVQDKETVQRTALLQRFAYDDETLVKGVLNDLVDSGLVFRAGRGDSTTYRAADPAAVLGAGHDAAETALRLEHLVWVAVHRFGPITCDELTKVVPAEPIALDAALNSLVSAGKAASEPTPTGVRFRSEHCLIGLENPHGWEAAVFDHYQAVVTAIAGKVAQGGSSARQGDLIGGSTYHYDVWEGHPMYDEVAGHLTQLRASSVAIREKLESYAASHPAPPEEQWHRFVAYVGQGVRLPEGELE